MGGGGARGAASLDCREASRSHCQSSAGNGDPGEVLLGDTEMVRNRIRAFRDVGVTTLRVAPQGRDLAEKLATLGRVMDLVRG